MGRTPKDLVSNNASLMREWDFDKNDPLGFDPGKIGTGSHYRVWWICSLGHEWQAQIKARCSGTGCPYCAGNKVLKGFNDLSTIHPELLEEWDYDKNKGTNPDEITVGSHTSAWWKCSNGHEWQAQVKSRHSGRGCPYCSGRLLMTGFNDLKTTNPEYLEEWNYDRNKHIKPEEIMAGSHISVWWKCRSGHEWQASPNHRISKGRDCPYCAHNPLVLKGVNDLETLRPDLLKEWDYEKNTVLPSEVTIKSNKTVWWKCFKGHEWRSKIEHRANGSSCPYCAKGAQTSFPEQAIYYYVKKAYPDAIHKYKDLFIKKGMELDVYIPSLQTGIEYDGEAYHNNPRQMRNDKEKSEICAKNNIRLIRLKEDPSVESANTDIIISAALGIDNALQELSNIVPGLSSIDVNKDADEIRQGYLSSLEEKSLLAINPELCNEWSYEKNKTTPDMYLPNSNAKVWWVCSQGHEWQAYIYTRNAGSGCPYCLNRIIRKGYNDLATKRPDLMKEWHPTKNNGLDPYQLSPGSGKKAWWICEKGHEWRAEISSRNKGAGCPECFDIRRRAGLNKKNVND